MTPSLDDDTVAMSESIGIGILVGMTIVVTAVVGVNVLVVQEGDDDGITQANFTWDYQEDSALLLVTHSRGDALEAGRVTFESRTSSATWAELASLNETASVEPGDIAQLGESNEWGSGVSSSDTITVYYNESGNQTQLDRWNGGSSGL